MSLRANNLRAGVQKLLFFFVRNSFCGHFSAGVFLLLFSLLSPLPSLALLASLSADVTKEKFWHRVNKPGLLRDSPRASGARGATREGRVGSSGVGGGRREWRIKCWGEGRQKKKPISDSLSFFLKKSRSDQIVLPPELPNSLPPQKKNQIVAEIVNCLSQNERHHSYISYEKHFSFPNKT